MRQRQRTRRRPRASGQQADQFRSESARAYAGRKRKHAGKRIGFFALPGSNSRPAGQEQFLHQPGVHRSVHARTSSIPAFCPSFPILSQHPITNGAETETVPREKETLHILGGSPARYKRQSASFRRRNVPMRRWQRRRAAVFVAVFAAAAFLVVPFLVPAPLQFGLRPDTPGGTGRENPGPGSGGEAAYKMRTVSRDMELTERLCRLQCEAAARRWLRETAGLPEEARLERLRRVRRQHPEWLSVAWIPAGRPGRTVTDGRDPGSLPAPGRGYWNTVLKAVRRGKTAQSPSFLLGGVPHFIAGIPDPQGRSGAVMLLVAADVVRDVERSQRRNMRLVPYPEEGRYRVESVRPDDLKDTTVREGEDNGGVSHYTVDEVVVKFRRPLRDEEILELRRQLDLSVVRKAGRLGAVYVFRSRDKTAKELMAYFRENWNPVYVEPHYLYLTNGRRAQARAQADDGITPNDTYYAAYQWNLPAIATERGWNLTRGSDDVVVAVIDT